MVVSRSHEERRRAIDIKQIAEFRTEGFLLLRGAITERNIQALREAILTMVRKGLPTGHNRSLSEAIIDLEHIDHAAVYAMQKSMATSFAGLQTMVDLRLNQIHSQLFDVPVENVHTHLFQTPVQFPEDNRFDFAWHQESGSYDTASDILTVWFPILGRVDGKRGSVAVIPRSHMDGKRTAHHILHESGLNDWVVEPGPEELETSFTVELEVGDALIFGSDLLHRSVANTSDEIRITGIARTVDMCSDAAIRVMAEPINYMDATFTG